MPFRSRSIVVAAFVALAFSSFPTTWANPSEARVAHGTFIDTNGADCIRMVRRDEVRQPYENRTYTTYNVEFSNRCRYSITLTLTHGSGDDEYLDVPPHSSARTHCTDGLPINNDCHGYRDVVRMND